MVGNELSHCATHIQCDLQPGAGAELEPYWSLSELPDGALLSAAQQSVVLSVIQTAPQRDGTRFALQCDEGSTTQNSMWTPQGKKNNSFAIRF